jgi:hypothetical protein
MVSAIISSSARLSRGTIEQANELGRLKVEVSCLYREMVSGGPHHVIDRKCVFKWLTLGIFNFFNIENR